ncbi:hypothetical protein Tco_0154738 [Tanacetum coccineum]
MNDIPDDLRKHIIEPLSKMTKVNKKQYTAKVRVINYLLQPIPNDIYNSVDACKNAKQFWERIKRLMYGSDVTNQVRHSRLMDEFNKFVAKEGESLESVYERLTMLVNIVDHNDVCPIPVSLQGDAQQDKLTTAMMLLARAISQKFSTPTNNRYGGNGNMNAGRQNRNQAFNAGNGLTQNDESNQIVQKRVPFTEQMLLAMKDEARSNLKDEENDFMLDNSYGDETLEEPTATVIMMARIQPADDNAVTKPTYDAKAVSEVNSSHKMIPKGVYEHKNHGKRKTVINTSDDDQIDSNIIFNDPYMENNGGTVEHDSNAHDQFFDIKSLAYNVQREAENQQRLNIELKKQKELLQKELETCKERVKTLEFKSAQCSKYKQTCDDLKHEIRADKDTIERILKEKDKTERDFFKNENKKVIIQHETQLAKKDFKARENSYLEDIVDLNEKLSSRD